MDSNNMFIISLDPIDLNVLPITRTLAGNKMMPIWAKSNLDYRNNDYYEFKVCSVDNEEESNESEEEMSFITCYICNTDVPSPFLNQHYNSVKHKINLKIANTALDRVRKCLNMNTVDKKDPNNDGSVYFCPVCVTVTDIKERKNHRQSVLHKNAVAVEKLLENFSNLYANDAVNSDSSDSEKSETSVEFENAINKMIKKESVNNVPEKTDNKSNANKIEKANEKPNVIATSVKSPKSPKDTSADKKPKTIDNLDSRNIYTFKELSSYCDVKPVVDKNTSLGDDVRTRADDLKGGGPETGDEAYVVKREVRKPIHHHLEKTLLCKYCKVCKRNLNVDDVDHMLDLNHEINYEAFLHDNALYKKDSRQMECKVCNVSFLCEKEMEHCDQIRHISNVEKLKKNKLKM